jgi:hypothetical protein
MATGLVQSFSYPSSVELREIEAIKLPRLVLNSPIFRHFPFVGAPAHLLQWRQKDNFGGMTQPRGLNGMPPRVATVGEKEFIFKPGVYGEHMAVDEEEITVRSAGANLNTPVPIDDLVSRRQDQLLLRRLNRVEWLCWQVVGQGMFVAHDVRGVIIHRASFAIQEYTAPVVWSDRVTSKPLEDLSNVGLLGRGTGTDFGVGAVAYANRITATNMARNTNLADFGGKRVNGGNTITSLAEANAILTGDGLPNVVVYDEGYDDTTTGLWTPYIPNNKVIVIGRLMNGEQIGEFRYTRNANGTPMGAPEPYTKVIEKNQVPVEVEVHDGFNGGPVIFYPGSVVTMNV